MDVKRWAGEMEEERNVHGHYIFNLAEVGLLVDAKR